MKTILIAVDSFKESMTSLEAAKALEEGLKRASEKIVIKKVPMADGGEGTVQALVDATKGEIYRANVKDPLGREIEAFYGVLGDKKTAIIEMAAASGLPLLKREERDPLKTTTYGTGELIKEALDQGCREFIIGIGGSATNDGGAGMFQALGGKLLDRDGIRLGFGGEELLRLSQIDWSGLDPRVRDSSFQVACDVDNPLLGKRGASHIYGPQKGATKEMIEILDKALENFAHILESSLREEIREIPGAGAAGGLGAGLIAFTGAVLRPGIQIVVEKNGLEEMLKIAHLVITGEGRLDEQTLSGKVPVGVAQIAERARVPVIAVVGTLQQEGLAVYQRGIEAVFSILDRPMSLDEALNEGPRMMKNTGESIMRLLSLGGLNFEE